MDYAAYFTEKAISAQTDGEQAELILQCAMISCFADFWSQLITGVECIQDSVF